jgi:hypothetical protein
MIYRIFDPQIGHQVLDVLEENKANYDVWNAAESICDDNANMEIGTDRWDLVDHFPWIKV